MFVCLLRLGKRTCLSSVCYRPSTESNVCPDQSTWPSRHRETICSCNRRPEALAVPLLRLFSAEFRSRQPIAGSSTPFSPRTVDFSLHARHKPVAIRFSTYCCVECSPAAPLLRSKPTNAQFCVCADYRRLDVILWGPILKKNLLINQFITTQFYHFRHMTSHVKT